MYAESYFASLKARGVDTTVYEQMTEDFYEKYPRKVWTTGGVVEQVLDFSHMETIFEKYFSRGDYQRQSAPLVVGEIESDAVMGDASATTRTG
jgi:hypothetical protein